MDFVSFKKSDKYNDGFIKIPLLTRYKVINSRPSLPLPSKKGCMVSN